MSLVIIMSLESFYFMLLHQGCTSLASLGYGSASVSESGFSIHTHLIITQKANTSPISSKQADSTHIVHNPAIK
jgi:hypothetical protein